MEPRLVDLSKSMSWLLRHGVKEAGVTMDKDGSVKVLDMLAVRKFKRFNLEDVLLVVENNDKKRFALHGAG